MALNTYPFALCCGASIVAGFPNRMHVFNWKNKVNTLAPDPRPYVTRYEQYIASFDKQYPDFETYARNSWGYTAANTARLKASYEKSVRPESTAYGRILRGFNSKNGYVTNLARYKELAKTYVPPPPIDLDAPCTTPLYLSDCADVKRQLTEIVARQKNYVGVLVVMVNVYQMQDFGHIFEELGWKIDSETGNPNHGGWASKRTCTLLHYDLNTKPEEGACKPKAKSLLLG